MPNQPNHLIIFTRYPVPGTTKTRLIPALGAEGAADLQRQLTEHTLRQLGGIAADISIYYSGGTVQQMQAWLGAELSYVQQSPGDLGDRLMGAFQESATAGYGRTVVIGIDCPDLTADIIDEAFTALENHDVVLGEATDGGYYLIGLQRLIPALFRGISWGTATVLGETLAQVQAGNLSYKILRSLGDIDEPEDLAIWEKIKFAQTKNP